MFWYNTCSWEWGWFCYTCDEDGRDYNRWVGGTQVSVPVEQHLLDALAGTTKG